MGYLSKTSITKTVPLSQGYSAEVRALRADEEDAVQAALLGGAKRKAKANTGSDGAVNTDIDLEFDSAAQVRETLLRGIVSWTLDEDDGTVWSVDAAHLALLTGGDRNALFVAINDLTSPPTDEEKKG